MSKTSSRKTKAARSTSATQHTRVVAAAREGVHAALRAHKRAGRSIVVWKDGKVVTVPPREIAV